VTSPRKNSKIASDAPPSKTPRPKDSPSMNKIDSKLVRQLASVLDETGLTEIEYELNGLRIRVARGTRDALVAAPSQGPVPSTAAAVPTTTPSSDPANHPGAIKAPMVGVAYLLPEPGAPPFVTIGNEVKVGQTIALIEAMKTFNPVKATKSGKVTSIIVENGSPVEYGEPLLIIE
jgi:acetyl-CoA carboxylase biotin carboxyl carrier protein